MNGLRKIVCFYRSTGADQLSGLQGPPMMSASCQTCRCRAEAPALAVPMLVQGTH